MASQDGQDNSNADTTRQGRRPSKVDHVRNATSLASSRDHNERYEPQILRAAEGDDIIRLDYILDHAGGEGYPTENLLSIALRRSAEKGRVAATSFLLEKGADPDDGSGTRLSPLLLAIERAPPNQIAVVKTLLKHGANPNTRDKKGRTALMTAAWQGQWHILELLIRSGADVNGLDNRGRSVLHNLGADTKGRWGDSIVELLLRENTQIDAKDDLGRTALHWSCVMGKIPLTRQLLGRPRHLKADIDAVEIRGKSALHLACVHDRDDVVELLLLHSADVNKHSDGGWTPLHTACQRGCLATVKLLLSGGARINERLLNGATSLHIAATGGHLEVVRYLLQDKNVKKAPKDAFGFTPFLRAAQHHAGQDCLELLASCNHVESLTADAVAACKGFQATIVDFGNFRNENRVEKRSVYGRSLVLLHPFLLSLVPSSCTASSSELPGLGRDGEATA